MQSDPASAILLLLIATAAAAATALHPSIALPDWALRIDPSGRFRLDGQHDTLPDVDVNAVATQSRDETLLEWAARWKSEASSALYNVSAFPANDTPVFLVVGAKTSVLHGFGNRQAIRQTWASAEAKSRDVPVVFLGCEPDLSMYSELKREQLRRAVDLEKRIFGDLLTSELRQCQDSFADLANKVKAYMQWVHQAHPTLAYAMVVDDDLYLRLDLLLEILHRKTTPCTRFFGGNSATSSYRGLSEPMRNPRHKYYLSPTKYPLANLPPFLTGCHYMLSRDLVRFIALNAEELHGLDALDDVTISLWLFALLRVEPTYFDELQILRSSKSCSDELVSLADLSTPTIRHIHANIRAGRRLCHDFQHISWSKQVRTIIVPAINEADERIAPEADEEADSGFDWDLRHNATANRLQIDARIVTPDLAVSFVYVPSLVSVGVGFCGQVNTLLQQKLFLTVGDEWCAFHRHALLASFNDTVRTEPRMRALLLLTRHNLMRSAIEDASRKSAYARAVALQTAYSYVDPSPFVVALSHGAKALQVLFECLFVALNPEVQVLVVHSDEVAANVAPDVFVVSAVDTTTEHTRVRELQRRAKRLFILASAEVSGNDVVTDTYDLPDERAVVLTTHEVSARSATRFEISTTSRLFSHTTIYSPGELLRARLTRGKPSAGTNTFGFFYSKDGETREHTRLLQRLKEKLPEIVDVGGIHCGTSAQNPPTAFCLDRSVEELKPFKFAFVHESSAMVSAFLAGCIPVYIGPPTAEIVRLFNPRAFVDCSPFQSSSQCGELLLRVDASPDAENELRQQPAIVDVRAFVDTFFWHPDAGEIHSPTSVRDRRQHHLRRLKMLL